MDAPLLCWCCYLVVQTASHAISSSLSFLDWPGWPDCGSMSRSQCLIHRFQRRPYSSPIDSSHFFCNLPNGAMLFLPFIILFSLYLWHAVRSFRPEFAVFRSDDSTWTFRLRNLPQAPHTVRLDKIWETCRNANKYAWKGCKGRGNAPICCSVHFKFIL